MSPALTQWLLRLLANTWHVHISSSLLKNNWTGQDSLWRKFRFDITHWLKFQQSVKICDIKTCVYICLCVCVSVGCCTAWCLLSSRWPYWETWRSWQAGSVSPSFIFSVVSLETSPLPYSCPSELRLVLYMNTCTQINKVHICRPTSPNLGGLGRSFLGQVDTGKGS